MSRGPRGKSIQCCPTYQRQQSTGGARVTKDARRANVPPLYSPLQSSATPTTLCDSPQPRPTSAVHRISCNPDLSLSEPEGMCSVLHAPWARAPTVDASTHGYPRPCVPTVTVALRRPHATSATADLLLKIVSPVQQRVCWGLPIQPQVCSRRMGPRRSAQGRVARGCSDGLQSGSIHRAERTGQGPLARAATTEGVAGTPDTFNKEVGEAVNSIIAWAVH